MQHQLRGLALFLCIAPAFAQIRSADQLKAQHEMEDQIWARKTGLPVADVHAIRTFVGISDTTTNQFIRQLDAQSLKIRNQFLIVDIGSVCNRVRVLERLGTDFKEVWSFPGVPDPVWGFREKPPGRENCAQVTGSVSAHGTADGRIVVEVRSPPDAGQRTIPVDAYAFEWNGKQYQPEGGSRSPE